MTVSQLRTMTESKGFSSWMDLPGPLVNVQIPLTKEVLDLPIEELCLSVRAHNGLKRAKINTIRELADGIDSETGLECVRNLGKKSIFEIKTSLLHTAYQRLSESRKNEFFQKLLEANNL